VAIRLTIAPLIWQEEQSVPAWSRGCQAPSALAIFPSARAIRPLLFSVSRHKLTDVLSRLRAPGSALC
jgi:hypothetical protein